MGGAHFVSHFFQLTLPPLFPLLRDDFGVVLLSIATVVQVSRHAAGR